MQKKVITSYVCDLCGVESDSLLRAGIDSLSPEFVSFTPSLPYFRDHYTEVQYSNVAQKDVCKRCATTIAHMLQSCLKHPVQDKDHKVSAKKGGAA